MIRILCCGPSQQWFGQTELEMELDDIATVAQLLAALAERHPEFAAHQHSVAVAAGSQLLRKDSVILQSEVALIPPVSGG